MGIVDSILGAVFDTFGVFLFPAAIFGLGVGLYLLLWWIASLSDEQ